MTLDLRQAAREYLEKMAAHENCCGVPLVGAMLRHIELHAGDTLSLDNEVQTMRQHWLDEQEQTTKLRAALDRIAFCGAGEDYRVLREIARKALETQS